jgi:hypothetical protein
MAGASPQVASDASRHMWETGRYAAGLSIGGLKGGDDTGGDDTGGDAMYTVRLKLVVRKITFEISLTFRKVR